MKKSYTIQYTPTGKITIDFYKRDNKSYVSIWHYKKLIYWDVWVAEWWKNIKIWETKEVNYGE